MALGSSMLATMRNEPPQWMQVFTSMPNTRLRRCAQVVARRRSMGLRSSMLTPAVCRARMASAERAGRRWGRQIRLAQIRTAEGWARRAEGRMPGVICRGSA